jgi:hypothetical protein
VEVSAIDKGSVPEGWAKQLARAVAATLQEYRAHLRDTPIALFAVDCHPWNGFLGLALLTAEEANADGQLADPAEMAAWRHYNFSNGLAAWHPAAVLGREMQEAYAAASDRKVAADAFLKACALAMASAEAAAAIELLDRDNRFRISVAHPDGGQEFYPPDQ